MSISIRRTIPPAAHKAVIPAKAGIQPTFPFGYPKIRPTMQQHFGWMPDQVRHDDFWIPHTSASWAGF